MRLIVHFVPIIMFLFMCKCLLMNFGSVDTIVVKETRITLACPLLLPELFVALSMCVFCKCSMYGMIFWRRFTLYIFYVNCLVYFLPDMFYTFLSCF